MRKIGDNKKAAIEMSIGTIVVIVLSMSMLILGLVLVRNIFSGATGIADLNENQIRDQIVKIYGDDEKLSTLPSTNIFEVEQGKVDAFAIRVQNLLQNTDSADARFSYDIVPDDFQDCGFNEREILDWMKGESGTIGNIPPGEDHIEKILIEVPEGTSLCKFKLRIDVRQDNEIYAKDQIFVQIKA